MTCLVAFSPCFSVRAAAPSPKADTDLLCHTHRPAECYPRIFQPTDEFQTVRDDQDLPPGLHVRMNLATGVKEARLNVPEPDKDPASSGLTIIDDSDLLGFKETVAESPTDFHEDYRQQPFLPPQHDVAESSLFSDSVAQVKDRASQDNDKLLPALTNLEDLSHSYHWGLSLAKDNEIIHKLFQLLLPSNLSLEVRSLATLVFGTAVHNNQAALAIALTHFYNDEWAEGPLEAVILALLHEQSPILLNRMMFLLSSLCQDQAQLEAFLDAGGVDLLIGLYNRESLGLHEEVRLRKKVTHFVLDHLMPADIDQNGTKEVDESDFDAEWTMVNLQKLSEEHRQPSNI
ncbi:MAG: hypothetical protein Q9209_005110 [Squamulea sp. 1 TL-2023]